jgi:hypothetical protein
MALRVFAGLIGLLALLFNAALMISDRAPGLLRRLGGELVDELSARIDADSGVTSAVRDGLPESDLVVHVGVWAVAVILAGVAVWSWRRLVLAAVFTFTASVFIEAAQDLYTDTRSVEIDDVVANGLGVAAGSALVALLYLTWSAASIVADSARRR